MVVVVIEIVFGLVLGLLGVYVLWILKGKAGTYGELLNRYGYQIGIGLFLLITIMIMVIKTNLE